MKEIVPAIMPKSYEYLKGKMSALTNVVPLVQIDVMDGKFVPNRSWPYLKDEPDNFFTDIINEKSGFPSWEDLDFEVDLMVSDPKKAVREWRMAGARRMVVHIESADNFSEILDLLEKENVPKDSPVHIEIGLALDIDTPNENIYPFVKRVDFVQFMGIDKIGFQGHPFDPRVIDKIKEFKDKFPTVPVSVDGGVNYETAQGLIRAGVDRLVIGSAIIESIDMVGAVECFKNIASESI